MSGIRKPGCIEPVLYFVNYADPSHERGFIMLAPYSDCPTPAGYTLEGAETLAEVDVLERKMVAQEVSKLNQETERDQALTEAAHQKVRDNLMARIASSACSEYEKDFIREWLKMRADHPKKKYFAESFNCYLWARHNNIGKGRGAGEESFNVEKHEVSE